MPGCTNAKTHLNTGMSCMSKGHFVAIRPVSCEESLSVRWGSSIKCQQHIISWKIYKIIPSYNFIPSNQEPCLLVYYRHPLKRSSLFQLHVVWTDVDGKKILQKIVNLSSKYMLPQSYSLPQLQMLYYIGTIYEYTMHNNILIEALEYI